MFIHCDARPGYAEYVWNLWRNWVLLAPESKRQHFVPVYRPFLPAINRCTEVICLVGTYILSIPAGVLGAAFHVSWIRGRSEGAFKVVDSKPCLSFSTALRVIGPSKLAILRTKTPLLYRLVHPSIGGSKILREGILVYLGTFPHAVFQSPVMIMKHF